MRKHYIFAMLLVAAVLCQVATADTLAWWRFEDGVAGEQVDHLSDVNGAYTYDIQDVSGNGNHLAVWADGTYGYRDNVAWSNYQNAVGANTLCVKNTDGGPAAWCGNDALQNLQPLAWTIEVTFKMENGGFKTLIGRDAQNVNTNGGDGNDLNCSALYLQKVDYTGDNRLAIKFCDVTGVWHEACSPNPEYVGFDFNPDPDGELAPWYSLAATSDGTILSLYIMEIGVDNGYRLIAQRDMTGSSEDTRLTNGQRSGFDGSDWDPGDFSVGRGLYGGGHGDRAYGYIDEVRISDVALAPNELLSAGYSGAYNFSTDQNADMVNVDVDVVVNWTPAQEPGVGGVNPNVTEQYVFASASTDPNLYYVGTTDVATSSIAMDLPFDSAYQVVVASAVSGYEQTFTSASTIADVAAENIVAVPYVFDVMASVPIVTEDPENLLAEMDAQADFTVGYQSVTEATVAWFKSTDDLNNTPDDDVSVGSGDTLTIAAATPADEGFYYAVVSNESGTDATSGTAWLEVKRLVAWYPFDDTTELLAITDMAGDNDGTVVRTSDPNNPVITYEPTADGNAVSFALTNQTCIDVPRMVQNSFSFEIWVKTTATANTGGWWDGMGLVDGEMPGWVADFGSSLLGSKFAFGAADGNTLRSSTDINDGQWHYCVGTRDYETGDIHLYVDGSQEAQVLNARAGQTLADPTALRIGKILNGGYYFDGQIDDIKISNFALTDLDVATAYNEATGESVCLTSSKPEAGFDLNDDCVVDAYDLAIFAAEWLDCGLYPDCE
ncbi:MAG: LamG-like jellyroll fold domain-containing protein [Phycisphaerae bacterium]